MEPPPAARTSTATWRRSVPAVLGGWVAARVLVGVAFVLAHLLAGHVRLPDGRLHLHEGLLTWDGSIYRALADHGYAASPHEFERFFPLFPLLGRWLGAVLGGRPGPALVVIANLAALAAGFLVWRIAADHTGDAATADRAAVAVALFPAGFSLVFAYSEGLFLTVSAAGLWMVARRRPWLAAPFLVLAGLTRPTGVLLVVPVAVAAWVALRGRPRGAIFASPPGRGEVAGWAVAVAGPVVGTGIFLAWVQATLGDGLEPLRIQSRLRAGFHEPVSRLVVAVGSTAVGHFRDAYTAPFGVLMVVLGVIAVRRRLPVAWTAYLAAGLVVALSADNIDSLGRYVMMLIPAWAVVLALVTRRRWSAAAIGAVSAVGLVGFTTAALLGHVIP